jgi:hypothetical protein
MNQQRSPLEKRNMLEEGQKRGCCGSTMLAIVVARRSWREISLWKTQHSKNSLNSVSTCLRVVDTRRKTTAAQTDCGTSLRSGLPNGVSRKCSGIVSSVTPMLARARSRRYSALASAWHFSARKPTLRTSSPSASATPRRAAAQSTWLREYAIAISTSPAFVVTLPMPLLTCTMRHPKFRHRIPEEPPEMLEKERCCTQESAPRLIEPSSD